MQRKLTAQEISHFWESVVPYFGLDESFDYDAHPALMREHLDAYEKSVDAAISEATQRAVKPGQSGLFAKDAIAVQAARREGFELAENLYANVGYYFRPENGRDDAPSTFPTIGQAWGHCCDLHDLSPPAPGGLFVGQIVSISDQVVTQRVGRAGEIVQHDISELSEQVVVGEVAEISYRDGRGLVKNAAQEVSR